MLNLLARAALIAASVTLFTLPAAAQTLSADESARIDAAVRKAMATTHATAAAVAVSRNGVTVFSRGYGFTDVSHRAAVTADTPFEIGSVTKQFTAAAILQLVQVGKVSLDDPVSKFLPAYKNAARVTVRQLLNQVSGLPEYTDGEAFVTMASTLPGGFEKILALVQNKPLLFLPGTQWKYSNTNYIVLGRIVELASHQTYDSYVRAHILAPAGMTHTTTIEQESHISNFPVGYALQKGKMSPSPHFASGWAWSAGDLVSTVGDLLAWDRAFFGGKIVSPENVLLATTAAKLKDGNSSNYGFGWIVDTENGHKRIWHNGGTFGFGASNITYPAEHLVIATAVNDADAPPQMIAERIYEGLHPEEVAAAQTAAAGENAAITARAKQWLHHAQTGTIDRTQLTKTVSDALTPEIVASAKAQLSALGDPLSFVYKGSQPDGAGGTNYQYRVAFNAVTLNYYFGLTQDGKISTLLFRP